jgi:hypothetical protein
MGRPVSWVISDSLAYYKNEHKKVSNELATIRKDTGKRFVFTYTGDPIDPKVFNASAYFLAPIQQFKLQSIKDSVDGNMHLCEVCFLDSHKDCHYYMILKEYCRHMTSAGNWGGMTYGPIVIPQEEWDECIVKTKFNTRPTKLAKKPSFKWVSL